MIRWIQLHRADQAPDAYLLRDWLKDHGIRVQIRGEALSSLSGAIPVVDSMPTVWVPQQQLVEARGVLEAFEAKRGPEPAWRCACGMENDGHFASCWSCNADQPGIPPHVLQH